VRRTTLAIVLGAAVLAACGGGPAWPKTAGETTCQEWTSQMNGAQRSALGAAMLLALRANDGGTIRPPDAMLSSYAKAVGDVCATTPDAKVSAVGATIYGLSQDLKP
jgi:hypothetical protein